MCHKTQARHQTQTCVTSATPATQNEGGGRQVPRLPRKVQVDDACHAKVKWMSPGATPAMQKRRGVTGDQADPSAPPNPAQSHKCHVFHAKRRWMSPNATPATQTKCKWMSPSAVPATPKCRGVTGDQADPSAPPTLAQSHKWHDCHAKCKWMTPNATPAKQSASGCRQVPHLPRKSAAAPRATNGAQARHQTQPSPISATPAMYVTCMWQSCV